MSISISGTSYGYGASESDDDSLSRVATLTINGEVAPAASYDYFGLASFASVTYNQPSIANTLGLLPTLS